MRKHNAVSFFQQASYLFFHLITSTLFIDLKYFSSFGSNKAEQGFVQFPVKLKVAQLNPEDVHLARKAHPEAVFMAHPECRPEILELADVITSTSGMIRYAGASEEMSFIVGTEIGLLYSLEKANPGKSFYPASEKMLCEDMKKITLEDIMQSLEVMEGEVKVPEKIRVPALDAVQRMIDLSLLKYT